MLLATLIAVSLLLTVVTAATEPKISSRMRTESGPATSKIVGSRYRAATGVEPTGLRFLIDIGVPNLALLNVGRRDIGFDEGSPSVIDPLPTGGGGPFPIVELNDQHALVRPDNAADLPVGTPARVGISHPCTTLDKWRVVLITDDDYNIVDTAATIF